MKISVSRLVLFLTVTLEPLANAQIFITLHHFTGKDGANPYGALVSLDSTLYGTTRAGGSFQNGTIFAINADGIGFTNLHHFTGGEDGAVPSGSLTLVGSTLYGTTTSGGSWSNGNAFSIRTDGTGFTNLHSFSPTDGVHMPNDGLAFSGGILYGTSQFGGTSGSGEIFAISTNGTGFRNLYSFTAFHFGGTNADGAVPSAGVICSSNSLFGTANYGGSSGYGAVYSIRTDGTGFTNLLDFTQPSGEPSGQPDADPTFGMAELILVDNVLYGTTKLGGQASTGSMFKLNTDGTDFSGSGFDQLGVLLAPPYTEINYNGAFPNALVLTEHNSPGEGTLFGTSSAGGYWGVGTVFKTGTAFLGILQVIYNFTLVGSQPFTQTNVDGEKPNTLSFLDNSLYGTTYTGGSSAAGTIFGISFSVPTLTTLGSDTNLVLSWPVAPGFKLQSTTNLASPVWTTNSPTPVVITGQYTVTNPISGTRQFFRLSQ